MNIKIIAILCFCLFYLGASSCSQITKPDGEKTDPQVLNICPAETEPFPSYHANFKPNETFCQSNVKPFVLSQKYPVDKPTPETLPWTTMVTDQTSLKNNWREYLLSVLKYSFEGNIESNWVIDPNNAKWFHAPYMHAYGVGSDNAKVWNGREYIHGLTQEKTNCLEVLMGATKCPTGAMEYQSWAVSFYNKPGGYFLGKVWRELYEDLENRIPRKNPNPAKIQEGFPEGTVIVKLLFTEADDPILDGAIVWDANINNAPRNPIERITKKMRLMQIDVAVREPLHIAPTGWIYGTFVYGKGNKPMEYPKSVNDGWLKFVPVGLMFGNNKGESINEKEDEKLPFPQHYGCDQYLNTAGQLKKGDKRTNGPIDNVAYSCIACHAAAETSNLEKFTFKYYPDTYKPECSNAKNNRFWFRNINPRNTTERTLKENAASLDFSLQLRNAIDRCCRDGREGDTKACLCEENITKSLTDYDEEMFR